MRFFHANDLTISAAAQLSHPAHHRIGPFDLVFALHSEGTTLACFHLAHALHFKPFAITNCLHGYLVFSLPSTNLFQDGTRTSNIEHRTSNIERRTSNIEHRTSNIERRTSNVEHRTS